MKKRGGHRKEGKMGQNLTIVTEMRGVQGGKEARKPGGATKS